MNKLIILAIILASASLLAAAINCKVKPKPTKNFIPARQCNGGINRTNPDGTFQRCSCNCKLAGSHPGATGYYCGAKQVVIETVTGCVNGTNCTTTTTVAASPNTTVSNATSTSPNAPISDAIVTNATSVTNATNTTFSTNVTATAPDSLPNVTEIATIEIVAVTSSPVDDTLQATPPAVTINITTASNNTSSSIKVTYTATAELEFQTADKDKDKEATSSAASSLP